MSLAVKSPVPEKNEYRKEEKGREGELEGVIFLIASSSCGSVSITSSLALGGGDAESVLTSHLKEREYRKRGGRGEGERVRKESFSKNNRFYKGEVRAWGCQW